MPYRLKNLTIDRVDLVDKGANPGAHVMLYKRDGSADEEPSAISKKVTATDRNILTSELKSMPMKDVTATVRRVAQMAAQGHVLTGFSRTDMEWLYHAGQKELDNRAKAKGGKPDPNHKPLEWGGSAAKRDDAEPVEKHMPGHVGRIKARTLAEESAAKKSVGKRIWERLLKAINMAPANPALTTKELLDADKIEDAVEEATEAFQRSVNRILNWPEVDNAPALLKRSVQEYATILNEIQQSGGEVAKALDATGTQDELLAALEGDPTLEAFKRAVDELGGEPTPTGDNASLDEAGREHTTRKGATMPRTMEEVLKGLSTEDRQLVEAELAKAKTTEAAKEEQPTVNKAELPEPVRKFLDDQEAARKAAETQVADLTKRIDKMQDEALTRDLTERAKAVQPLMKAEDFVAKMKTLEKADPEAAKAFEASLVAAAKQQADVSKLLHEVGRGDALETGDDGSAESIVKARAAEIRKNDPKITEGAAMDQVFKADPQLERQYLAEQQN